MTTPELDNAYAVRAKALNALTDAVEVYKSFLTLKRAAGLVQSGQDSTPRCASLLLTLSMPTRLTAKRLQSTKRLRQSGTRRHASPIPIRSSA
jgi:hypothetical protein